MANNEMPKINVVGPLESQDQAGYMGPESAPFKCSNCIHFQGEGNDCEVVEGPIAGEGCCNEFEPSQGAPAGAIPMGRGPQQGQVR